MVEIFRKGFRLEIPSSQVITFKKAQNLNGVQDSYSYSNTFSLDKTANIIKLLDLPTLPMGKLSSLQNGYEVDLVFNGSIQLRRQRMQIVKETTDKVDLYIIYSESTLIKKLKELYINEVTKALKYKKTDADFALRAGAGFNLTQPAVFTQTQSAAGQYVLEEMPLLINLRYILNKAFTDLGYTLYGDFMLPMNKVKDYYVAPNAGIYQVYSGTGDGFSPSFDVNLTAFELLQQTLAYFNCYASVDDTYKTVIINQWINLDNYKTTYKDYSKFYVNYKDYQFQSKLAKRNEMTYSDSESTFNSFFSNNLSTQDKATYLASKFGSGSTQLFDDSEVQDDGTIPLRANGELGETSALRIYKLSPNNETLTIFGNGTLRTRVARKALSVSMRDVYNDFHKNYIDFIREPLIQNLVFRYDDILAADFSLTEVFFIEQLSSYWIPLEISFSTKKDMIQVKCMLVKQRKVLSPILNNFNSVLLDFKQRKIFPKTLLQTMYPMPPNAYAWDEIIFKSYDQNKNRLFVNGVLVPAASLPQAFTLSTLAENAIEIEANKPTDSVPDLNTAPLNIQAVDTNGGVSNEAYINIKHTGKAVLESNFVQNEDYAYNVVTSSGDQTRPYCINVLEYVVGPRPNLNNTITSVAVQGVVADYPAAPPSFNLIATTEAYTNVTVAIQPFSIKLESIKTTGSSKGTCIARVILFDGVNYIVAAEVSVSPDTQQTFNFNRGIARVIDSIGVGKAIKVFIFFSVRQTGAFNASLIGKIEIKNFRVNIKTTKTI